MSEDTGTDTGTGAAKAEKVTVAESDESQKTDGEIVNNNNKGNKSNNLSSKAIFSILIVVAIAISIIIYAAMRRGQKKARMDQFTVQADEMNLSIERNVDEAFASLDDLSVFTTSVVKGLAEENDYPAGFITIPDLAQTLDQARNKSGSLMIAYMPKVLNKNLELWESYSRTHSSWIVEEQPDGPMNVTHGIVDYIWEFTDYAWENDRKRRLVEMIGDSTPGLRGNEHNRKLETNRVVPRPGDFSGKEEERRASRELSNDDDAPVLVLELEDVDSDYDDSDYDDKFDPGPSAQVAAPRSDEFYTPVWQLYPVPVLDEMDPFVEIINYDLSDRLVFQKAVEWIEISKQPVLLEVCDQAAWFLVDEHRDILQTAITYPVFEDFSAERTVVGYYTAIIPWTEFFRKSSGSSSMDVMIVVKNSCGEVFSVRSKGNSVDILGEYDAHDREFDDYGQHFTFAERYNKAITQNSGTKDRICLYDMQIYPTENTFL